MSYLVLARKYRPKNFSEVSGQDHVVRAIQNSLKQNKVHHALLFSGTRGVGKTTIARLFAKALNCLEGVSPELAREDAHLLGAVAAFWMDLSALRKPACPFHQRPPPYQSK